jgi:hypothetical protein
MTSPYKITHITNYTFYFPFGYFAPGYEENLSIWVNKRLLKKHEYTINTKKDTLTIHKTIPVGSHIEAKNHFSQGSVEIGVVRHD